MKIACGTVVFREYELEKVLAAIREIGYEWVETQSTNPWCNHVVVDKDDPIKYAQTVKKHGFFGTTALWTLQGALIPCGDDCVPTITRTIEWAGAAGIPVVNCGDGHKPDGMSETDAFARLSDRVLQLVEVAERNNVILAIEPHGTFSLTGAGLKRILSITKSPRFGINYDCANIHRSGYVETKNNGHSYVCGNTPENEVTVLSGIINRVVHFHAKDLDKDRNCLPLGRGEVLVAQGLELLKKAGYTGAVSLETEGGMPFEASVALAKTSYQFLTNHLK
jgi:sugar phosphate isomerase/epimerase